MDRDGRLHETNTLRTRFVIVLGVLMLAVRIRSRRRRSAAATAGGSAKNRCRAWARHRGQSVPSEPIKDLSVYFPLQEKVATYQVMAGPKAGSAQDAGSSEGQTLEAEDGMAVSILAVARRFHP